MSARRNSWSETPKHECSHCDLAPDASAYSWIRTCGLQDVAANGYSAATITLTGCRLVSLPLSDHCEPLCDSSDQLDFVVRYLQTAMERQQWKYLELCPTGDHLSRPDGKNYLHVAISYFLHRLSLRPGRMNYYEAFALTHGSIGLAPCLGFCGER
jgi:hypothetical protein